MNLWLLAAFMLTACALIGWEFFHQQQRKKTAMAWFLAVEVVAITCAVVALSSTAGK